MKLFFIIAGVLFVIAIAGLWILAKKSQNSEKLTAHSEVAQGRLAPCDSLLNCANTMQVSSLGVSPVAYQGNADQAWTTMRETLTAMGGTIEKQNSNYLWATFRSPVFGFVDDVEILMDDENKWFNLRSSSRVGRSDFSVNKQRIETIEATFIK